MKVVDNLVEYTVDPKVVASLRRSFNAKLARRDGLSKADMRDRMYSLLSKPGMLTDPRPSTGDAWRDARRLGFAKTVVSGRLCEQLVRQWVREGYIERCGFGRYKLAVKA